MTIHTYEDLRDEFLRGAEAQAEATAKLTALTIEALESNDDLAYILRDSDEFTWGMLTAVRAMIMGVPDQQFAVMLTDGSVIPVISAGAMVRSLIGFANAIVVLHEGVPEALPDGG